MSKTKSLDSLIQSARAGAAKDRRSPRPGPPREGAPPAPPAPEPAAPRVGVARVFDSLWSRYESKEEEKSAATVPVAPRAPDSEAHFRTLFDHSADSLFLLDLDGTIVDLNARACARLGYSPAELLGRNIDTIDERPDGAARSARDSLEPDRIAVSEAHHVTRDGQRIPVQVRTSILVMDGNPRVLYSATDTRDRKALENQVRQYQRMEAISRLAGGIAHDFNNALTAILSHAEFLLEDLGPDSPLRTDAEQIRAAARRVSVWTQQMLALSRDPVHETEVVDCGRLVRETAPMLQRIVGDRVHVQVTTDGGGHVRTTAGRLSQLLLNLADNARDAMPAGGLLTVSVGRETVRDVPPPTVPALSPGDYVTLLVTDTGRGMDEATAAQAFEPFFTSKPGGSGMGLAVVYGLVAGAGGGIHLETAPGMGARFTLYFPSVKAPAEAVVRQPVLEAVPIGGTETILLVEDDEAIRRLAQRALARLGYQVLTARDAGHALVVYNRYRHRIHLLITDVVMPNMSGGELVRRLQALGADLKVLYMTGYADDVLVQNGIEKEGAALLRKPFTPEPLAAKVRAVLDGNTAVTRRRRILFVDDDPAIRRSIRRILREEDVVEAASVAEAIEKITADPALDGVLCDVGLADGSGLDLHRWLADMAHPLAAHLALVSGGIQDPTEADYARRRRLETLEKPFEPAQLHRLVDRLTAPKP